MINTYEILGRERINLPQDNDYLTGKRVLVTGAGGSVGASLCRTLAKHTNELIMLDRDESALHALQLSLTGRALLDDRSTILGDIRDKQWIDQIMAIRQPEIIFHAAALKHQPLLERYPMEAIKTNVIGTWNVLRAAADTGTKLLINVSTDKATDPICVLGSSKRIAERLTSSLSPLRYLSVRFGNVLGSRGSVLETLMWQIGHGLPLTVTSPLISRYFITPDEANDLLLLAGATGSPGDTLIMDMGSQVRIADMAKRLIAMTGSPTEIVYTGVRRAERTEERMMGRDEIGRPSSDGLVWHVDVPPLKVETDDLYRMMGMSLAEDPTTTSKRLIDVCDWTIS